MLDNVLTQVDALLMRATEDGRKTLYEHEVYEILRLAGLQTPEYRFVQRNAEVTEELLAAFGGKEIMLSPPTA